MDPAAFRALIEHVRAETDLVALIGERVALSPSGSVRVGRSPFNAETRPSFVVWPHTRTWRDFSGGGSLGGDCFAWLQRAEGLSFLAALRLLAARAGIALPGDDAPGVAAELSRLAERRRLSELHTRAAAYYHRRLPEAVREAWYRKRYGFSEETIDELLLGWADGGLFEHLTGQGGASREEALATGLFVVLPDGQVRDFFVRRLVFPYWSHGRVVYFIARATEQTGDEPWEQAKYKKLPVHSERHPYISPALDNDALYGEDSAAGAAELLITEGVTDCISARQCGVPCVSPVTVRFRNKDHPRLLALTAKAKRVVICNDAEASGAGEAGALETARVLADAGRDVRIASIPRPPEREKVDLNELVVAEGPEGLKRVLASARPLLAFLLERIPEGTTGTDLEAALAPLLPLLARAGPLERDAHLERLKARFQLRAASLRELLREAPRAPEVSEPPRKGEVFEGPAHYYEHDRRGGRVVLSSFRLEPRQRIRVERGELFEVDVTTETGRRHPGVRLPLEAWHSRRAFLAALPSADMQWMGSDENVQGVLRLLTAREVPCRAGTQNLGYLATPAGPRWVTPEGVLAAPGQEVAAGEVSYVPSGASLDRRVRYPAPERAEEARLAAALLPDLLAVNAPEVVLPVLGWFLAAPLKPRLDALLGHFPLLMVWGTQGSGKTSLVLEVFWPLLGISAGEPYGCTATEFALLKLLSCTNSVPVFMDEYRPFDMPRHRRDTLHRLMRRLYAGEVEERGRADLSVRSLPLSAPLCLAGETRPTDAALVERMLVCNPQKDRLLRHPEHRAAFDRLRRAGPGRLAGSLVRFLLGRDTTADLALARGVTREVLGGREVPPRVEDNLAVMALGLHHLEEYAAGLGVALPELPLEAAVESMLADLFEGKRTAVKTGLDFFLEELSVMAVKGAIQPGREYTHHGDRLALHFPACHAAFAEHCRRMGFEGEVPDRKALRRQLVEAHERQGYVSDLDVLVPFSGHGDRRRAALIDLALAKESLQVDDFPRGAEAARPYPTRPEPPED